MVELTAFARALPVALAMVCALPAAAVAGPGDAGPLAVFWSGGYTWAVDAADPRLMVAPGWWVPGPEGLTRYRLRRVAQPMPRDADRLPRAAHRWTVFEQLRPGARRWVPLTEAPEPPVEGQLFDEHHVVQFAGHRAALMRSRRVRTGAATLDRIEAMTLDLPGGERHAVPPDVEPALGWLKRTLPGLIEPCVDTPAGLLTLDTPGGISARWLALTGVGRCADRAHALVLDRPPADRVALEGARWIGERLVPTAGPPLSSVVDVRPTADGRIALLLSGASLPTGRLVHRDLARFDDPCTMRDLTLWRDGRTAPLGQVPALDGVRWLPAGDPVRARLVDGFMPADGSACHAALGFESRPPSGLICRVVEDERPWSGPDDLSASAWAEVDGSRLLIHVEVHDPQRTAEDGIELYLGAGRRPKRVHLGPDGLEIRGGRRTRRAIAGQVDARWTPQRAGYHGRFAIDRRLLGRPPQVTIRVDDVDPDVPGVVYAWPAGHPIDGRNPNATPMEPAP